MKKKNNIKLFIILQVVCMAFFMIVNGYSAKWRVNKNTAMDADFHTLRGAFDSSYVQANDTLYLEGAGGTYGSVNLYKPLVIIGPGYLLGENNTNGASIAPARITEIDFETGTAGSVIMGCTIDKLDLFDNSIVVKRNRIKRIYMQVDGLSDIYVIQNFIYSENDYECIFLRNNSSNILIKNNFIKNDRSNTYLAIEMESNAGAEIINNVIDGHIQIYNSVVQNNIMVDDTIRGTGNTFSHNISHRDFPSGTDNQEFVDMSTVFDTTCATCNTTDGKWQILGGSVAEGAGVNGEDCGMYGGLEPYKLSGIPNIPSVYFFNAATTGSATEGLSISIKARSNK